MGSVSGMGPAQFAVKVGDETGEGIWDPVVKALDKSVLAM